MESDRFNAIIDQLVDMGFESSGIFTNPNYDDAIIGVTDNGNVVYSYDRMVQYLMDNDNISEIDAIEFIDTNVFPVICYMDDPQPIIMYDFL